MSHVHELEKHIASDDEQLPDSTGAVITYCGPPKADFTQKERFAGGAGTVEASTQFTAADGSTGTIVDQAATYKYGWTEGGVGPIIEVTTKARVDLAANVTSF
jgi:hypothetical protein